MAAGNSGAPSPVKAVGTISNASPWYLTVGASTMGRDFMANLTITALPTAATTTPATNSPTATTAAASSAAPASACAPASAASPAPASAPGPAIESASATTAAEPASPFLEAPFTEN
ncbi:unnamed protein product, partial [Closterium sp. NIES-53]